MLSQPAVPLTLQVTMAQPQVTHARSRVQMSLPTTNRGKLCYSIFIVVIEAKPTIIQPLTSGQKV